MAEVRNPRAERGSARVLGGRYRLDALIGSGGSANVHRGLDLRLHRAVAVKVFRAGTGFDTEEDFRSEAMILARLQHQGLVTAYDAGSQDGEAFLVMQLIDGPTLKTRIAEGPLPWETTAALGAHLADALAHAHDKEIVHRDVKPSNIILDASGRPHLTDFGISRLLDATTRTATATLIGTAAYLSPEQVLGQRVGRPADVYALGLVLLECLTGRLEYDGGPLESAIARLHRRPVLPDFLPEAFAALLRDMTALDQQTRPSARDCAQVLTRLAADATLAASAPRPAPGIVPRPAADHTDRTHRSLSPAAGASPTPGVPEGPLRLSSRPLSARGRLRARGSAAALAALAAVGLVVGDGFSHRAASNEAAPSVTDPATPSASHDSAAHHDGATRLSRSPSPAARPADNSARIPGTRPPSDSAGPATRAAAPPPHAAEQTTADTVGKGKGKGAVHGEPPGQTRKNHHGRNAAHAR